MALDRTFAALADPTRRAILLRLAQGETTVSELAGPFAVSLPAISRHLRVLERAGLLQQYKVGRVRRCRLQAAPLQQANGWLDFYRQFWAGQLDALADYLENPEAAENPENAESPETARPESPGPP